MIKKIQNKKIIYTIIIVCILLLLISMVYIQNYFNESDIKSESKLDDEIDDRISPFNEQAIFIEIKRIRAKGIIEKMTDTGPLVKWVKNWNLNNKGPLTYLNKITGKYSSGLHIVSLIKGSLTGIGWDKKPTFSYSAKIDDFEWIPGDPKFTTWDTEYIFNEFYKVVEEEQPKSEIEIRIIENGDNKAAELCKVTYDYRKGTWNGDDYQKDSDGYGHYNGTKYEIWFDIRQTDYDGDRIPFWTEENILKTNPKIDDRKLDPDKDNCSIAWEWKGGYDPFTWDNHTFLDPDNDGIQNVEEEYMEKWLANPYQPEIYIEADYSENAPDERPLGFIPYKIEWKKGKIIPIKRPIIIKVEFKGQEVIFWEESQDMLMELFNKHGIAMHVDDGCMGGGGEKLDLLSGQVGIRANDWFIPKYYKNNFADNRKGIFRYIVLTVTSNGYNYNMNYLGHYDTIVVAATDIIYSSSWDGKAKTPRAQRVAQAISLLHELGHSCGFGYLHCGGVDNISIEAFKEWYDYKSVMNYYWFSCRYFDYSDGSHGINDIDDWATLDVGFFQRNPGLYDLEGISFDGTEEPFNRGER